MQASSTFATASYNSGYIRISLGPLAVVEEVPEMTTPGAHDPNGQRGRASPLLDARAAAAHLGVSVATLRAATSAGEVAHVRLQGRGSGVRDAVRWLVEDLDEWVLAHRVPAATSDATAATGRFPPPDRPTVPAVSPRAVGRRGRTAPLLSARATLRAAGKPSTRL